jgi:hypothetical protein
MPSWKTRVDLREPICSINIRVLNAQLLTTDNVKDQPKTPEQSRAEQSRGGGEEGYTKKCREIR